MEDEVKPEVAEQIDPEAQRLQSFLEHTQKSFDKYFDNLGYICFIFKKEDHKGESVYVTNSPNDILPVLEPYANAKEIAQSKAKKSRFKTVRRV